MNKRKTMVVAALLLLVLLALGGCQAVQPAGSGAEAVREGELKQD